MFHVPFANRVVSPDFLRDRKLEKIYIYFKSAYSYILKVVHESCIFLLQFAFFVPLGYLLREISGVKIQNEFKVE